MASDFKINQHPALQEFTTPSQPLLANAKSSTQTREAEARGEKWIACELLEN